jgi:hypothetical protein
LQIYNIENLYLNKSILKEFNFDFNNKLNLLIKLKKKISILLSNLSKNNNDLKKLTFLNLIHNLNVKKVSNFNFFLLNNIQKKKHY